jgi:hypothetical protein
MKISATCSLCGKTYTLPEAWAGKRVKCSTCGSILTAGVVNLPDAPARAAGAQPSVETMRGPAEHRPESPPIAEDRATKATGSWSMIALVLAGCSLVVATVLATTLWVAGRGARPDTAAGPRVAGTVEGPRPQAAGTDSRPVPGKVSEPSADLGSTVQMLHEGVHPAPVQDAVRKYEQGKYAEAYDAIRAYADSAQLQYENKYFGRGRQSIRPSDVPDPAAYLLKGMLQLFPEDRVCIRGAAPGQSPLYLPQRLDEARKSFENAIGFDPTYREKIRTLLNGLGLELAAATFSPDEVVKGVVARVRQHIRNREYRSAGSAITGAWDARQRTLTSAEEIANLLSVFGSADAEPFRKQVVALRINDDRRNQATLDMWRQVLPELAAGMQTRTSQELLTGAAVKPGEQPSEYHLPEQYTTPIFVQKPLFPGAVELYAELLRQRMAQVRHDPRYRSLMEIDGAEALLQGGIRYPVELLPKLLDASKKDSGIAMHLLGDTMGTTGMAPKPARIPLGEPYVSTIWKTLTARFCEVVILHATKNAGSNYQAFCAQEWPGVDIEQIAQNLGDDRPDVLTDEDFCFAYAWNNSHVSNHLSIQHADHKLPAYLKRWPQGRYVGLCVSADPKKTK